MHAPVLLTARGDSTGYTRTTAHDKKKSVPPNLMPHTSSLGTLTRRTRKKAATATVVSLTKNKHLRPQHSRDLRRPIQPTVRRHWPPFKPKSRTPPRNPPPLPPCPRSQRLTMMRKPGGRDYPKRDALRFIGTRLPSINT